MDELIGIDVGGTNIKYGLVDLYGNIKLRRTLLTEATKGNDYVLEKIISSVEELISLKSEIVSVGLCIPGIVNNGIILISPNMPGWENYNLKEHLEKYFGLHFEIENDANAAAIAEMEIGNGSDFNNFIYVTLGTGIGGAIIYNRQIFHGSHGGAGEIGHTALCVFDKSGDLITNYKHGTLEYYAGRKGILKKMNNLLNANKSVNLNFEKDFDVKDISEAANKGDALAKICIEKTGEYIGAGLSSSVNLLNITNIVIGGGISGAGDRLFNSIKNAIEKRVLPPLKEKIEIRKAFFDEDSGLVGAAMMSKKYLRDRNVL